MGWNKKVIAPAEEKAKGPQFLYSCPGLCRFFGALGSLTSGLVVFFGGIRLFGLKPLDLTSPDWTAGHIALLVAAIVVMWLASVQCFTLASTIQIRSELLDDFFNVLWQFLANGSMTWVIVLGVAISLALGREEAKALIQSSVTETSVVFVTLSVLLPGICLGLLLGVPYFLAINNRFPFLLFITDAIIMPLGAAYLYFIYYGIDSWWWILPGIAFPLLLLIVAPPMIQRDRQQRRIILEAEASNRDDFQPYKRFF